MVVTLAPQSLTGPTLLVTFDSGSGVSSPPTSDASAGRFEIQGKHGWYELEGVTASTVTKLDTEFVSNSATGDWYKYDPLTGLHKFALCILFTDAIHVVEVRAKG